jgi:hypothetical protein
MTNTMFHRFTRYVAAPVICAGAIGGAALGLAGIANAQPGSSDSSGSGPTVKGPDVVATPHIIVRPTYPSHRHRVPMDTGLGEGGGE